MSDSFVHLHTHSSYSLLDGLGRLDDLVAAARRENMPALALTDHGVLFGAAEFYEKAREGGVKPIVGCEVYVADRPLDERPGPGSRSYHLVLLAENETGYRNLIKLTTDAHIRGFYRKPRVDHALLKQYNEGLICLSGCASAEVPSFILEGNLQAAEERADWYRQVFRDRYYMELQHHGLDIDAPIVEGVVRIADRLGLPLVATNDVHYVEAEHARTHEVLLCIQTQTTMTDPKRMRLETPEFYLKSADQMLSLFGQYSGALHNTLEIADRCNLELTFGRPQLPQFETPEGQGSEAYLRSLCADGLVDRFGEAPSDVSERLEYELDIICRTGFVDYFLLVHDIIHEARSLGVAVGPGRGSAAGSLVSYVLRLTNVDPIAHGLSFERFLNPERVTMPDMDLDFADDRRDEVIKYVTEKYGRERVAQIITFGTLGPRAGVRDVGRVQGMAAQDVDRVAKLVPFMCSSIRRAREEVAELQQLYEQNADMRSLMDTVETLEGVARHASTHAAGVVISRDPLAEHVPLYKVPKSDQVTTQYAMSSIEKIGLLKMDFLGLRTLTVIERASAFIRQSQNINFSADDIDLADPSIYELLRTGESFGVFQLDSTGMRRLLRELAPDDFEHIVALNALYRPGPMDEIPRYVSRRHGREEVSYPHPALEEVLRPTHGVIVYQEQVMRLFNLVAGYSLGEADLIRRAMGKKKASELAKHYEQFLERAEARGTSRELANHLWRTIEPFAGYAFNKSHAAAYTVLTCQTSYLKANYPREFMAGLMSAELGNAERVKEAVGECRRLGIKILAPDINRSSHDFALEDNGIRFGLCAVKHVGTGAIDAILEARAEGGPFTSLEDFCERVDWQVVNKRVLESLCRCGAFDSLGLDRARLVGNLDRVVAFGTQLQRSSSSNQVSLFGDVESPSAVLQLAVVDGITLEDKLAWEEELLGMYVSPHPLLSLEPEILECGASLVTPMLLEPESGRARAAGLIKALRSFPTRTGQTMATIQLSDTQNSLEVVIFSRAYGALASRLIENEVVVVEGNVDVSDGRLRMIADEIMSLAEAKQKPLRSTTSRGESKSERGAEKGSTSTEQQGPTRVLLIELDRGPDRGHDLQRIEEIYSVLQRFHGSDEVEIHVRRDGRSVQLPLPNKHVRICDMLLSALKSVLPQNALKLDSPPATSSPST